MGDSSRISTERDLWYEPGEWLCLAGPALTVLLGATTRTRREALWSVVSSSGSPAEILDALISGGLQDCPPFAVVRRTGEGLRILARGPVEIRVDVDGAAETVSGAGVQTWVERGFPRAQSWQAVVEPEQGAADDAKLLPLLAGVVLARHVAEAAAPTGALAVPVEQQRGEVASHPPGRARAGSDDSREPVPSPDAAGRGGRTSHNSYAHLFGETVDVSVEDAAVRTVQAEQPAPSAPPGSSPADLASSPAGARAGSVEPGDDGETVLRSTADRGEPGGRRSAEPEPGRPGIPGVLCPAGHPNPPTARRCRACNAAVPPQAPVSVKIPCLGVLRFSTGPVVELDRPVLVGRAPSAPRTTQQRAPRLVTVDSPNEDVSRTHLELRPDGWDVLVIDLGSTNGTTIWPADGSPKRLRPREAVAMPPGSHVNLADEVQITFEASV